MGFSHACYKQWKQIEEHIHTHYEQLTDCFPEDPWCLCCRMECASVYLWIPAGACSVSACVLARVCVCVLPAGGWSGSPCKGDMWRLFGVWTWQVSSLQPANFLHGSSPQSYHILYSRNNKLSREKGGPPATAHAASSKTGHTHKHTPTEAWLNVLACNMAIDRCSVNWVLLQ